MPYILYIYIHSHEAYYGDLCERKLDFILHSAPVNFYTRPIGSAMSAECSLAYVIRLVQHTEFAHSLQMELSHNAMWYQHSLDSHGAANTEGRIGLS